MPRSVRAAARASRSSTVTYSAGTPNGPTRTGSRKSSRTPPWGEPPNVTSPWRTLRRTPIAVIQRHGPSIRQPVTLARAVVACETPESGLHGVVAELDPGVVRPAHPEQAEQRSGAGPEPDRETLRGHGGAEPSPTSSSENGGCQIAPPMAHSADDAPSRSHAPLSVSHPRRAGQVVYLGVRSA